MSVTTLVNDSQTGSTVLRLAREHGSIAICLSYQSVSHSCCSHPFYPFETRIQALTATGTQNVFITAASSSWADPSAAAPVVREYCQ